MATRLLIFAVLIQASFAFWLIQRPQHPVAQAGDREVNQACLQHALNGDCEFYNCFEQRLPCGDRYYIKKHGAYYCNKTMNSLHLFDAPGQQFLTNIKRCLMEPLQAIYSRDSVDCHNLEHEAVAAIAPCFNQYDFCTVVQTNADQFFRIYEIGDLFSRGAGSIWRALLRICTDCGGQFARQLTSYTSDVLLSSANSFFNSLGNLGTQNIFGNDIDEAEETA